MEIIIIIGILGSDLASISKTFLRLAHTMLRPAIDSCGLKINFFYSDLRRPSQLQQSKPPVTSVNKPLCKKGKYHLLLTSCLFSLNSAVVWSNPTVQ